MKVVVVGTGYVGLVQGVCLAELGNQVVCVDTDASKIQKLRRGVSPIYEPGIEELIKSNQNAGRIHFETDLAKAMKAAEVVFIAVGTPPGENGKADLRYVLAAAEEIGQNLDGHKVIVNKSTVPIGTGQRVKQAIAKHYPGDFDVVSNPEFLREGSAIDDFMKPDRIVIGVSGTRKAAEKISKLYKVLERPILITDLETAEMIKYASNSFLATQVSFINTLSRLCEKVGANVDEVASGMKLDKRIGERAFLSAGLGYGGSCFPKDVTALVQISSENDVEFGILEHVEKVNQEQRRRFVGKVEKILGTLKGKKLAVWGLSFKPKTDDVREAPSITIIEQLLAKGAHINAYDPVAHDTFKLSSPVAKKISFASDSYSACKGADALLILTEWDEFRQPNFDTLKEMMNQPLIFDGRNVYTPADVVGAGFDYHCIGKSQETYGLNNGQ